MQYGAVPRYQWKRLSATGPVASASGVLHTFYVNTTLGATVTLSDAVGNILVLASGIVAGSFSPIMDFGWQGTLTATFAGAGDITFFYK